MAITERTRHHMIKRLEDLMGEDDALTLVEHLPPVGWADVATRADTDRLAADIDRIDRRITTEVDRIGEHLTLMEDRIAMVMATEGSNLRAELHKDLRTQMWGMVIAYVSALITVAGLVLAAVRLGV